MKTIVFFKNDKRPFFIRLLKKTIINEGLYLTIVNEGSLLTIVNEGSSLTIVNEGLLSYMQEKVVDELKLLDIFFKTTQCKYRCPSGRFPLLLSLLTIVNEVSSLTIVNEGSFLTIVNEGSSLKIVIERFSLTIVNETTNFLKTIVFENDLF